MGSKKYEIWGQKSGLCNKWHEQTSTDWFVIFMFKLIWMKRKYRIINVYYRNGYDDCIECLTERVKNEMFSDEKINLNEKEK